MIKDTAIRIILNMVIGAFIGMLIGLFVGTSSYNYGNTIAICSIIGAILGYLKVMIPLILGMKNAKMAAERERLFQEERKQRQKYASELNKEINLLCYKASEIQKKSEAFVYGNKYYGSDLQENAWKEMNTLELLRLELFDIINEYKLN